MLVVGAGLLASSLVRLYRSGVGFDPKGLDNISFSLDKLPLKGDAVLQFYRQLEDGLRRQPGVASVSFARMVPFSHFVWDDDLAVSTAKPVHAYFNQVGPDYFQTMRIPIFTGRDFNWSDTASTGLKVILNQAAAKGLFPNRSPLGQIIIDVNSKPVVRYEVIGVVGNAKYEDLRATAPATAYLPMTQDDGNQGPSYNAVIRTNGLPGPLAMLPALWPRAWSPRFLRRCSRLWSARSTNLSAPSAPWPCLLSSSPHVRSQSPPSASMAPSPMPPRAAPAKSAYAWHLARAGRRLWRWSSIRTQASHSPEQQSACLQLCWPHEPSAVSSMAPRPAIHGFSPAPSLHSP